MELQHCLAPHQMEMRWLWGCSSLQTFLIMWQSVLWWAESIWCVEHASYWEKALLREREKSFPEKHIIFCWAPSWCRKMKKSIYFCNLVLYCLSFILLFKFLFHKLHLCYFSVAQDKHRICLKLCAVPTAHIKCVSAGKSLPVPVTARVWQNI